MTNPIPILVLAWNKQEITMECLASIAEHTRVPHRIILIDNGSELPYPESDDYDLVRLPKNLFYTKGINAGLRFARQHYPNAPGFVLLNNDIKVRPHWLERLSSRLPPQIGLTGNKHLRMDDPTLVVHGGTADLMTGMHKAGPDESHFDRQSLEVWVTFACVFITRDCLEQVGLLDERMLHFYSDTDYCLRVWMAGFEVAYHGDSVIEHKHHESYGEVPVNLASDRRTFENKWLGHDLNTKVFHKIFIDAEERTMMNLTPNLLRAQEPSQ